MDLTFTPEEIAFRDEARHFFRTAIPESIRAKVAEGEGLTRDDMITAQRILNARGWCTVNWPVEWGGQNWTPIQVYLYQDEMQQANCPSPIAFNVSMVGPVIAQFGSQALCAGLDRGGFLGTGQPGKEIQHRTRPANRLWRLVDREAHRSAAGFGVVAIETLYTAVQSLFGNRLKHVHRPSGVDQA